MIIIFVNDPTVGPLFRVEDVKDTIQTSVVKDINFVLSLIRTCFDADAWCKVETIYNEKEIKILLALHGQT